MFIEFSDQSAQGGKCAGGLALHCSGGAAEGVRGLGFTEVGEEAQYDDGPLSRRQHRHRSHQLVAAAVLVGSISNRDLGERGDR
jgi:hypothetical protein